MHRLSKVYSMSEKDKDDLEEEEENLSHNGACVFVKAKHNVNNKIMLLLLRLLSLGYYL
jgi:hypothetical protein